MRNPYEVLGVATTAPAADIRSAYRKLAKKLHPDLNPGDKGSEEKFKEVTAAYDLLGDERNGKGSMPARSTRQARSGRLNSRSIGIMPPPITAAPIPEVTATLILPTATTNWRSCSGAAQRRARTDADGICFYRLPIEFAELITGANKRVTLPDGGTLDIVAPPGVVDGQVLRLRGKGAPGVGEGAPGDALVEVEVLPDRRFTREGDDIILELPISLSEAVLGGAVRVPTATGAVTMTVPKGSNTGTTLRLKGKGVPRRGGGAGDQLVKLKVVLPKPPDPELEQFVASWEAGRAWNPREEAAP